MNSTHLTYLKRSWRAAALLLCTLLISAISSITHAQEDEVFVEPVSEDITTWNINAGAIINTGNTEAYTLTAGTDFYMSRGNQALTLSSGFNYGRANGDLAARNWNSRARYDYFLTDNDALFAALAHRWDTFAGLKTRLQLQLGYLRNFIKQDDRLLWGEVGYDYTHDRFFQISNPSTRNIHSVRLFAGYRDKFQDNISVYLGLEALFNLNQFERPNSQLLSDPVRPFEETRINFEAAVAATLVENLALGVNFKLLYDSVPAAAKELDTITTIQLTYTLL